MKLLKDFTNKNSVFINYIIGLLATIYAAYLFMHGYEKVYDLEWLDTLYDIGRSRFDNILERYGASFSPLYSEIIRLIKIIFKLTSEKANYALYKVIYINAVLFYCLLFKSNKNPIIALIGTFIFLISTQNILVQPKVSLFTLSFIFIGFTLSEFYKNNASKSAVIALTLLVCSYLRPELIIGCFISVLTMAYFSIKPQISKKDLAKTLLVIMVIVGFAHYLSLPIFEDSHGRSATAFSQHFILSWNKLHHQIDAIGFKYREATQQVFHRNEISFTNAIKVAPQAVFIHMGLNLIELLKPSVFFSIFYHFPIFVSEANNNNVKIEGILLTIIVLSLLYTTLKDKTCRDEFIIKNQTRMIVFAPLAISEFISSICIYPRDHYMIFIQIYLLFFLLQLIYIKFKNTLTMSSKQYSIICLIIALITPRPHALPIRQKIIVSGTKVFMGKIPPIPISTLKIRTNHINFLRHLYNEVNKQQKETFTLCTNDGGYENFFPYDTFLGVFFNSTEEMKLGIEQTKPHIVAIWPGFVGYNKEDISKLGDYTLFESNLMPFVIIYIRNDLYESNRAFLSNFQKR